MNSYFFRYELILFSSKSMNSYYPFACEFISLSGPLVKPKGGAVRQSSRKTALTAEEEGEEEEEWEEEEE